MSHAAALALLEAWQAPDEAQEALRSSYAEHLRAHRDGHLRSCRPDHLTASVLVVSPDASQVLLTHHRRADAWFQLGGLVVPGDALPSDEQSLHELVARATARVGPKGP